MSIEYFEADGYLIATSPILMHVQTYLAQLGEEAVPRHCVDIGAADGLVCSNTLYLFIQGWEGLALEADPEKFIHLENFYREHLPWARTKQTRVTPDNICDLLSEAEVPPIFGFLSLDIDSFDYDVLAALLPAYRPTMICAEINEKIPPPIRFRVPYRDDHTYTGDHFYGMSLSSLVDLAQLHNYDLIQLCFNNALLVAREHNRYAVQTPAEAYAAGYLSTDIPEYNQNMAPLQSMSPEEGLAFLNEHFANYAGRYEAGVEESEQ